MIPASRHSPPVDFDTDHPAWAPDVMNDSTIQINGEAVALPDSAALVDVLRSHGIEEPSQLEEAYSGCFPSVEAFSENLIEECYSEALDAMPTFLQTAVDYEMVWHQSLQYDYIEIYFNYEYYFFNRNV